MSSSSPIDWSTVHRQLAAVEAELAAVFSPAPERKAAILEERATRIARQRSLLREAYPGDPYLLALAGKEQVLLPLAALAEVVVLHRRAPVPGAPPHLLGIVALRGELYSVLDPGLGLRRSTTMTHGAPVRIGVVLRHARFRVMLGLTEAVRIERVDLPSRIEEDSVPLGDDVVTIPDLAVLFERLEPHSP